MRLRTVSGKTITDALDRVNRELGPNALVLETRTQDGNTEVIAAEVEREEPADGLMRLRAEVALLRRELSMHQGAARPSAAALPARSAGVFASSPTTPPRLVPVEQRLQEQGVDAELVRRALRMLRNAPDKEGNPLNPRRGDYVLNCIAGMLPGAPAAEMGQARAFLFTGPSGAGKTTTIAKLAVQVAGSGNRSFALLTLDGDGPAASDLLSRTAERLGVPFRRVRGAADMGTTLRELGHLRMLLIDTGALTGREQRSLSALTEARSASQITSHLVMPANLEASAMRAIARTFLDTAPSAVVLTKVDETRRFGELLNLPVALQLPVSALGHGRSIEGDLAPATRRLVAEIVLGRKVLVSGAERA